jgi:hypothetical protein
MCMSCRSLFVLLYFFFWPLCCLFFYLRILITHMVFSNSSSDSSISHCQYVVKITSPKTLFCFLAILIKFNKFKDMLNPNE